MKDNLNGKIKNEILSIVSKNLKVKDVILFGSYAYGNPEKDSDIDLIVILDENGLAKNYREKLERTIRVSSPFYDLRAEIPMDILVYTKDEWDKAKSLNSSFIREITKKGVSLL